MRIRKASLGFVLGASLLIGCGASQENEAVSMKQPALKSQAAEVQTAAETTVIGITKSGVKDRPEATRVIFMLDKKASYSTSRENNQLIVNVFNAQMKSSLKELEVQDQLVKAIVTKQVGNSVKGVIESSRNSLGDHRRRVRRVCPKKREV